MFLVDQMHVAINKVCRMQLGASMYAYMFLSVDYTYVYGNLIYA